MFVQLVCVDTENKCIHINFRFCVVTAADLRFDVVQLAIPRNLNNDIDLEMGDPCPFTSSDVSIGLHFYGSPVCLQECVDRLLTGWESLRYGAGAVAGHPCAVLHHVKAIRLFDITYGSFRILNTYHRE